MAESPARRRIAIDDLDRAIVDLFARINAATYEALVLVREFDERAGWLSWGFESCAQWLHWRCDLSPNAARERVRVAHALKVLPAVSAAFARGRLSYSKVRALVRVATPADEASLLAYALEHTAARVEERCRQLRHARPESVEGANRAYERRAVRVWRDPERGLMTLTVELPLETGERVCRALDRAVEESRQVGPEFESVSWPAQQADAVVTLAESYLTGGSHTGVSSGTAQAYQVIVHVDESALGGTGTGRADLPVESVRRLACDGSVVRLVDGVDGRPLEVGRRSRTVPSALKRALWARDRGCSFPGCTHTRFVDAHHVRHWAEGGETKLENLMLLCGTHHRLVHEGGYRIEKDLEGRWFFRRTDGRTIPAWGYHPADTVDLGRDDAGDDSAEWAPLYAPHPLEHKVREPPAPLYAVR